MYEFGEHLKSCNWFVLRYHMTSALKITQKNIIRNKHLFKHTVCPSPDLFCFISNVCFLMYHSDVFRTITFYFPFYISSLQVTFLKSFVDCKFSLMFQTQINTCPIFANMYTYADVSVLLLPGMLSIYKFCMQSTNKGPGIMMSYL